MLQFFSYTPRSGSRVLTVRPAANVLIAYPGPGTICAGDIVQLSYHAACPGMWWRDTAGRVARQIVEAVGGLAEDAQGCITLCVPRVHAYRTHCLMSFTGGLAVDEDANMHALLLAECVGVGEGLAFADRSHLLPRLHESGGYAWYADSGSQIGAYMGCGDACPHCEGQRSDECRCTTYRPLVCPVRISDAPETGAARFAIRYGLYSDAYDRWGTVWATVHNKGSIVSVSLWGGKEAVAHRDHAETHSNGTVTWSKAFVRTLDADGNVVTPSVPAPAVHYSGGYGSLAVVE